LLLCWCSNRRLTEVGVEQGFVVTDSPTAKGNSSIGVLLVKQPHIFLANLSRFFAGIPTKALSLFRKPKRG